MAEKISDKGFREHDGTVRLKPGETKRMGCDGVPLPDGAYQIVGRKPYHVEEGHEISFSTKFQGATELYEFSEQLTREGAAALNCARERALRSSHPASVARYSDTSETEASLLPPRLPWNSRKKAAQELLRTYSSTIQRDLETS